MTQSPGAEFKSSLHPPPPTLYSGTVMTIPLRPSRLAILLITFAVIAHPAHAAPLLSAARETAMTDRLNRIVNDEASLRLFLQPMPKGGELHIHSWGTAFAETDLAWARDKGFCAAPRPAAHFLPPPCRNPLTRLTPADRTALIDALTEASATGPVLPRHDHFFATFDTAAPVVTHALPEELALLRATEARQNTGYVEFMSSPDAVDAIGERAATLSFSPTHPENLRTALTPHLPAALTEASHQIDRWTAEADHLQNCPRTVTSGARPLTPCAVTVRFLATVTRTGAPARVFGEMLAAFALAHADSRVAGVNILAPEDDPTALADYSLHMQMFRYLATQYPDVRYSLHAGELTRAVVPPEALASHIAEAVAAGASRIGHGTDIASEDHAADTLTAMARRPVAVEINLTSNDVILGVHDAAHPLRLYLRAGVPVTLSTDDPGVLRTDLTQEYVRAVREHHLTWSEIRNITRNSLEFSFLPGQSLWQNHQPGTPVPPCAPLADTPTPACAAFLKTSEKARQQWQFEQDTARFETETVARPF